MKRLVVVGTVAFPLVLGACSTLDEITVENTCAHTVTVEVVEISEGFSAENAFIHNAVLQPGASDVVAGLVNFGGEDRGVLKVLETGWSIDFNKELFDDSDGLVVLPPTACPE